MKTDLIDSREAAKIAGIERNTLIQLINKKNTKTPPPPPVLIVGSPKRPIRLYSRAEIVEWARIRDRTVGRKPK